MECKASEKRVKTLRTRFVEYGCSERFELVEVIDRSHVSLKCKACGNVFARYTSFLNPSKSHNVGCNKCGIHADGSFTNPRSEVKRRLDKAAVADYYSKGFGIEQTAAKFQINARRVARIIDEVDARRKPDEMTVEQQRAANAKRARKERNAQPAKKRIETIKRRFHERGCDSRFEIAEILNRTHIVIRCLHCGREFKRETAFIDVEGFNSNIGCPECGIHVDGTYSHTREYNKKVDEAGIIEYYERGFSVSDTAKKFDTHRARITSILESAGVIRRSEDKVTVSQKEYAHELTGDPFLDEEFVCAWCGREFTRHDYMVFEGRKNLLRKTPDYCSRRCSRRAANEQGRRLKLDTAGIRRRRLRRADIKKIPLGDLMERDKGVCQICGEQVDLSDIFFDENGYSHAGDKYPSMDHIVPVSRGGKTEWGNVQLAHLGCNGKKHARTMEEYVAMEAVEP